MLGACPPQSIEAGCAAEGVTLVAEDGSAESLSVPGLAEPNSIAFSTEGELWAAGVRLKDHHSLLVGPWRQVKDVPRIVDLSRVAFFPLGDTTPLKILPGNDGLLTVSRAINGTHFLATFSETGEFLGRGSAPPGTKILHGSGNTSPRFGLRIRSCGNQLVAGFLGPGSNFRGPFVTEVQVANLR